MRAAILLAAGSSRRFGAANKLLAPLRGRPLLHHSLRAALAAPVARVVVVTGADRVRIGRAVRAVRDPRIILVHARRHREGRRASLAAGLAALRRSEREVFVFLADMPGRPPALPARLLRGAQPGDHAVRPAYRGAPGHPVLIRDAARACRRLAAGKAPFEPGEAGWIVAGRGAIGDVDRPGDLRRLRR